MDDHRSAVLEGGTWEVFVRVTKGLKGKLSGEVRVSEEGKEMTKHFKQRKGKIQRTTERSLRVFHES